MECQRIAPLVLITLLQLCRAQNVPPQWYSAKINDNFQPKPISEIFTTEPSFSTGNPIIVTQRDSNSIADDVNRLSSPLLPSSQFESTKLTQQTFPSTTTSMPAGAVYQRVHIEDLSPLNIKVLPQQEGFLSPNYVPPFQLMSQVIRKPIEPQLQLVTDYPARVTQVKSQPERQTLQTYIPSLQTQQTYIPSLRTQETNIPSLQTQETNIPSLQTQQTNIPSLQTQQTNIPSLQTQETNIPSLQTQQTYIPSLQTEQIFTPGPPITSLSQVQTQTTPTQPTSTQLPILAVSNPPQSPPPYAPPNSNYFWIYQQVPQSITSLPPSSTSSGPGISEVNIRETMPTTFTLTPRTSEVPSTTRAFPITSISTTTPLPTTWLSTTPLSTSTLSSSSVTVTPSSTLGLSTAGCISSTPTVPSLLLNRTNKKPIGIAYPLKIRVISPQGSITNVNINPATTTTRKPTTQSTTRKPTTRRTSKPKKNNYDRCLDGCRKVKDPICAAPLSHREIDPKTLRGFPSVCHMACHNSYRKNPFEKVIEGNCSQLRTQIRLIDSRKKLKKNELRKNQYSVDQGQNTVIELSGLAR